MTNVFTPDLKHRACPFDIYKSEGDNLFQKKQYAKAVVSYSQALCIRPENLHCYIRRSKCYLQLSNSKESMNDVETALRINPLSHEAIYQKAEIYYYITDFENALIYYHRGKKLRPDFKLFDSGIGKAGIAIKNVIGDCRNVRLKINEDSAFESGVMSSLAGVTPELTNNDVDNMSYATRIRLHHLLGEFYNDFNFMERMKSKEEYRIKALKRRRRHIKRLLKNLSALRKQKLRLTRTTNASRFVIKETEDALLYLARRSEFWKQQEPMYKRMTRTVYSNSEKLMRDSERQGMITAEQVILTLEDIATVQKNGDHTKVIKLCHKLRNDLKSRKEIYMPELEEAHADIWAFQGVSQFQQGNWAKARDCFLNQWKLCISADLDHHKARCLENLGRAYAKLENYPKALEIWLQRLNFEISGLDMAWIQHEIGRCYIELKDYDMAIEHATKCQEAAFAASDSEWDLNSNVLIAQANYLANYLDEAITYFEVAHRIAYSLGNFKALVALDDAMAEVNVKLEEENNRLAQEERNAMYGRALKRTYLPQSLTLDSSDDDEFKISFNPKTSLRTQDTNDTITTNESTAFVKRGLSYKALSNDEEEEEKDEKTAVEKELDEEVKVIYDSWLRNHTSSIRDKKGKILRKRPSSGKRLPSKGRKNRKRSNPKKELNKVDERKKYNHDDDDVVVDGYGIEEEEEVEEKDEYNYSRETSPMTVDEVPPMPSHEEPTSSS